LKTERERDRKLKIKDAKPSLEIKKYAAKATDKMYGTF
jgi:hypothetical protein